MVSDSRSIRVHSVSGGCIRGKLFDYAECLLISMRSVIIYLLEFCAICEEYILWHARKPIFMLLRGTLVRGGQNFVLYAFGSGYAGLGLSDVEN